MRHHRHRNRRRLHRGRLQLRRGDPAGGHPAPLGATVVMTRTTNDGVGPCVNVRAAIGNQADSDAVIDIHADGGPPGGRGFAVLEPVADGPNNAVIAPSDRSAVYVRNDFVAGTGEPFSDYDGVNGLQPRDDLGRPEPDHGAQSSHRVRQHAQRHRRRAADRGVLAPESAAAALARGLSQFLIGYP